MGKDEKLYRHSSTFYRKCEKRIRDVVKDNRSENCSAQSSLNKVLLASQPTVGPFLLSSGTDQTPAQSNTDIYSDSLNVNVAVTEEGVHVSPTKLIKLLEDLKKWAITHRETISSLNDLLTALTECGLPLPKDGRSLLGIFDNICIKPIGQGQLWYNGIAKNLENSLTNISLENISQIELLFNIDGMSLFNSTASEVWPISFAIYDMPLVKPMFGAVYYGSGKPPLEPFLDQFITEMQEVLKEGVSINGRKLRVKVKCFICDTPARAFLKGTPYFNSGKSSCIKCTVEGVWDKKGRHMSYPMFECPRRTDSSFRNKEDEDHHVHDTPLVNLPINMVEDFVIADSLHLFDLGIMRKCLMAWCNGSYNFRTKLRGSEIDLLNEMLELSEKNRPIEIQRNIRGVKFLKYWKGTEYRVMLLYLGIVVLKDILSKEVYEHFLLLSCAVTILSSKTYLVYIDIARNLLEEYLEGCINIYGYDSISSNFHNLCHVIDDVEKFGCLPGISTYQFENSLGQLKSLVRSGKQPLSQIAQWVTRFSTINSSYSPQNTNVYVKGHLGDGIYKKIYFHDFMLSDDEKNSWFLSKGNDIVKMQNVTQDKNNFCITGSPLASKQDFFSKPFQSSYLNIYSSVNVFCNQSGKLGHKFLPSRRYGTTDIKCKLFHLRYKNTSVFLPLLHTLDPVSKGQ